MRILALSLSVALLPCLVAPAGELPANTWVKVGEKEAGCRVGSAAVWLAPALPLFSAAT